MPVAAAQASFLVYSCGENLCRVGADGSGQSQLTSDGGYSSPSLSADGSKLAFIQHGSPYWEDLATGKRTDLGYGQAVIARMRPDGQRVAFIHTEYSSPTTTTLALIETTLAGTGTEHRVGNENVVGYLGTNVLTSSRSATRHNCNGVAYPDISCEAYAICRLLDSTCPNVADDPNRDLYDAAGSPDGKFVAVSAEPYPATGPHPDPSTAASDVIAVYDAATGALVRDLTARSHDHSPAWSPDGSRIAFDRGGTIYTMPADGSGSQRALVAGVSPTWAGGSDAGPSPGPGPGPGGHATAKPRSVTYRAHCHHLGRRRICTMPQPLGQHTYHGHASQGQTVTLRVDKQRRYATFTLKGLRFNCADGSGGTENVTITAGDRQRIAKNGTFSTEIGYDPGGGYSHEVVYVVGAFDGHSAKGVVVGNTELAGHGQCTSGTVGWSARAG
jgi:hypothetical protein